MEFIFEFYMKGDVYVKKKKNYYSFDEHIVLGSFNVLN